MKKGNVENNLLSWWGTPVEFSEQDANILKKICDLPPFVEAVKCLINEVSALKKFDENAESKSELQKKIKDGISIIQKMLSFLNDFGDRSQDLLDIQCAKYMINYDRKTLETQLRALKGGLVFARDDVDMKKFRKVAANKAACGVRDLFNQYGLKLSIDNTGNAAKCLRIVFKHAHIYRASPKDYLKFASSGEVITLI